MKTKEFSTSKTFNKSINGNRILKNVIIINDFDYVQGGASKVAIQTANLIKQYYPELNVYFFSGDHNENSILDGNVINICTHQGESLFEKNKLRGMLNGLYNFKARKELHKLLKKLDKKETIVHIHGWTKCLSSSVFGILFKMKFKIVLTLHDYFTVCPNGGFFNYKKNVICNLSPMSKKCIGCNCDSRNYFFKIYRLLRHFTQNNIVKLNRKIENVIVISEFSRKVLEKYLNKNINLVKINNPLDLDSSINRKADCKHDYYLYVGRISKEKGVDIFCDALTSLHKKGIVVGDGPQKKELETKYCNINFVGWKNSKEVKEYMVNAKALIIPSRWFEGAPLTPLEAMQYKIPFFSSNCNASTDYFIKEKNNFIFELTVKSLSDKIQNFELMKDFSFAKYFDISYIKKGNKEYLVALIDLYKKRIGESINEKK